jgi:hypothetical protein
MIECFALCFALWYEKKSEIEEAEHSGADNACAATGRCGWHRSGGQRAFVLGIAKLKWILSCFRMLWRRMFDAPSARATMQCSAAKGRDGEGMFQFCKCR